jgi:hypothetical protein
MSSKLYIDDISDEDNKFITDIFNQRIQNNLTLNFKICLEVYDKIKMKEHPNLLDYLEFDKQFVIFGEYYNNNPELDQYSGMYERMVNILDILLRKIQFYIQDNENSTDSNNNNNNFNIIDLHDNTDNNTISTNNSTNKSLSSRNIHKRNTNNNNNPNLILTEPNNPNLILTEHNNPNLILTEPNNNFTLSAFNNHNSHNNNHHNNNFHLPEHNNNINSIFDVNESNNPGRVSPTILRDSVNRTSYINTNKDNATVLFDNPNNIDIETKYNEDNNPKKQKIEVKSSKNKPTVTTTIRYVIPEIKNYLVNENHKCLMSVFTFAGQVANKNAKYSWDKVWLHKDDVMQEKFIKQKESIMRDWTKDNFGKYIYYFLTGPVIASMLDWENSINTQRQADGKRKLTLYELVHNNFLQTQFSALVSYDVINTRSIIAHRGGIAKPVFKWIGEDLESFFLNIVTF